MIILCEFYAHFMNFALNFDQICACKILLYIVWYILSNVLLSYNVVRNVDQKKIAQGWSWGFPDALVQNCFQNLMTYMYTQMYHLNFIDFLWNVIMESLWIPKKLRRSIQRICFDDVVWHLKYLCFLWWHLLSQESLNFLRLHWDYEKKWNFCLTVTLE